MKVNNHRDVFFVKVFNIQDNKKLPKVSLFFIFAVIFEFTVALPVYSFLSKKIGAILLIVVLATFITMSVYFIFKVVRYFFNKK